MLLQFLREGLIPAPDNNQAATECKYNLPKLHAILVVENYVINYVMPMVKFVAESVTFSCDRSLNLND